MPQHQPLVNPFSLSDAHQKLVQTFLKSPPTLTKRQNMNIKKKSLEERERAHLPRVNAHNGLGWARVEAGNWDLNPSCGWQESSYLKCHLCFPGFTLAGSSHVRPGHPNQCFNHLAKSLSHHVKFLVPQMQHLSAYLFWSFGGPQAILISMKICPPRPVLAFYIWCHIY